MTFWFIVAIFYHHDSWLQEGKLPILNSKKNQKHKKILETKKVSKISKYQIHNFRYFCRLTAEVTTFWFIVMTFRFIVADFYYSWM